MNKIKLVFPDKFHKTSALEFKQEFFDNEEKIIYGSSLLDKLNSFDEWLYHVKRNTKQSSVSPGWVVASTFFAFRESDNKIIGIIDLRHTLNHFLENYAGHIGYSVRPSERKKGYGYQMLRLGIDYLKNLNLKRVLISCSKDNIPSSNLIKKCGGVLIKQFVYQNKSTNMYAIDIV